MKREPIPPQDYDRYTVRENHRSTLWTLRCVEYYNFRPFWLPYFHRAWGAYQERRGIALRWGYWEFTLLGPLVPREESL